MDALTYRLDDFEGPLDLLLTLIHKNKVDVTNIPIALICDQYMAFIGQAEKPDMELASEFLVMASELMLIKSKMMLPRAEEAEEDPRAALTEALLRYQEAKAAAVMLGAHYTVFSGRMVKDTDEISVDKTFVADQDVESLLRAVRRILAYRDEKPRAEAETFTPMIAAPIIPVETKIIGILHHFDSPASPPVSLDRLLNDATSLPDMIAIFLGVLELVKMRRIRLVEDPDAPASVLGTDAIFTVGEGKPDDTAGGENVDATGDIPQETEANSHGD